MRPGILAVRAANEYRSRDLISYVGLRYYLLAESAKSDRWAREIATELVRTRSNLPYRTSKVYKGVSEGKGRHEDGIIEYRTLHLPGPNEMLCESALLDACSLAGGPFNRSASVFSNVLSKGDSRSGMVDPYFKWWKLRQEGIATICRRSPEHIVLYLDLSQFYPSIDNRTIDEAWQHSTKIADVERQWINLGMRIINDYRALLGPKKHGLPMGPMFAHMLGNLVLSGFDRYMEMEFSGVYFRYVDDIALVIPKTEIKNAIEKITAQLPQGLQLNHKKQISIGAKSWLANFEGFASSVLSRQWMQTVGAIKAFIITKPDEWHELFSLTRKLEFRFPFLDYSVTLRNRSSWDNFKLRLKQQWFWKKVQVQTIPVIIQMVLDARRQFLLKFYEMISNGVPEEGMPRKLYIQRIRYLISRLLYLADSDQLKTIESMLNGLRELADLKAIYRAIIFADVTDLLPFSESVVRVAAQLLANDERAITCTRPILGEEMMASWAMMKLYGVRCTDEPQLFPIGKLAGLASIAISNEQSGMRSELDPFFQEIMDLRRGESLLPEDLLRTALDEAENPVFDALSVFRGSS